MHMQIANDRIPPPDIIESLCWPCHGVGLICGGRPTPNDWIDDLREHGVKLDTIVPFQQEDVLARFKLIIQADGSFQCEPEQRLSVVADHAARLGIETIKIITNEGDTADSLYELLGRFIDEPDFLYPLDYHCRISILSKEDYALTLTEGQAKFIATART